MAAYCGGLLFLAGLVKEDVEAKMISIKKLCVFGILALLYLLWKEPLVWQELFRRVMPGMFLLFLSWISRESIGYGDGAAVMVLGLWTGVIFTLATVCIGTLAAGFWSLACLIRKKTEPIPFIPFLLLGMEVALVGI
ncbi:MAG: hypothetical protein IJ409_02395 [Lachnospiraceae bacterium]|nr:hypothetical protein [Lachnospiraceae bacterium]